MQETLEGRGPALSQQEVTGPYQGKRTIAELKACTDKPQCGVPRIPMESIAAHGQ